MPNNGLTLLAAQPENASVQRDVIGIDTEAAQGVEAGVQIPREGILFPRGQG